MYFCNLRFPLIRWHTVLMRVDLILKCAALSMSSWRRAVNKLIQEYRLSRQAGFAINRIYTTNNYSCMKRLDKNRTDNSSCIKRLDLNITDTFSCIKQLDKNTTNTCSCLKRIIILGTIWTELELFHIFTYHQEVLDWMMIRDSALLGSKFWRVLYLKIRRS